MPVCIFGAIICSRITKRGETLASQEGEEETYFPVNLDDSTNFQLALTLFRLREIARHMRFFRSHYVTWNTMARVE